MGVAYIAWQKNVANSFVSDGRCRWVYRELYPLAGLQSQFSVHGIDSPFLRRTTRLTSQFGIPAVTKGRETENKRGYRNLTFHPAL